jgi:spore coat protein YutH
MSNQRILLTLLLIGKYNRLTILLVQDERGIVHLCMIPLLFAYLLGKQGEGDEEMNDWIKEQFLLELKQQWQDGHRFFYRNGNYLYTIEEVTNIIDEELEEYRIFSSFLKERGDSYMPEWVLSKNQTYAVKKEDREYIILQNKFKRPRNDQMGKKLARFHLRGLRKWEDIKVRFRGGMWTEIWSERLNEHERAVEQILQRHPDNQVEELYVKSFPYYSGLAENAIQYIVDSNLDATKSDLDQWTICHERFTYDTWGSQNWIHHPFDLIVDHRSRDLAEYIRSIYWGKEKEFPREISKFLQDYHSVNPLSAYSLRLLFGRLLFPLHFFECIERYYETESMDIKLQVEDSLLDYTNRSRQYEQFLTLFNGNNAFSDQFEQIPKIEWLIN